MGKVLIRSEKFTAIFEKMSGENKRVILDQMKCLGATAKQKGITGQSIDQERMEQGFGELSPENQRALLAHMEQFKK